MLKFKPGDVLVVDAKGFVDAGRWGDVLTAAALKAGVAGLVINGAVRDASAIVEMGFPVFCRGLSIKGTGKLHPGNVNVPICIGDVLTRPGDVIVADREGLVIVSPDEAESVLESASAREGKGDEFRSAIERGVSTKLPSLTDRTRAAIVGAACGGAYGSYSRRDSVHARASGGSCGLCSCTLALLTRPAKREPAHARTTTGARVITP